MARRRIALTLLLLAGLGAPACNVTPTLPLPPPAVTVFAPDVNGSVRISGVALERAYVSVLNNDTDLGVITRAGDDGNFTADIAASAGDRLEVWQEQNGEVGEHIDVGVPQP